MAIRTRRVIVATKMAFALKSSPLTGTCASTIVASASKASSHAGLRGPKTRRLIFTLDPIYSNACWRVKTPSFAASSKLAEKAALYDSVFPAVRRRISLSDWIPRAFRAIAIGTSSCIELCRRYILPFFVTTYVFDFRPPCVDL